MIVGLTTRLDALANTSEVRACIDVNWFNFLKPLAKKIEIIQTFNQNFLTAVKDIDLLILTGGNDPFEVCNNELSKQRDEVECHLIKACIIHDIPIVGICRGMQILNLYFGGTLFAQDNHVRSIHSLDTSVEWLESVNKVNSFHNWSISRSCMSSEFYTTARCIHDDSIEAFQHNKHKIRGVMWHPERWDNRLGDEKKYYSEQRKIFEFLT